jgi:YHS domain-containing protein
MATDPVCGMNVDEGEAMYTLDYYDRLYYFCSEGCKAEFERHTEDYVKSRVDGGEKDV